GSIHRYEFAHDVPLFSSTDTTSHWVSYTEESSSGEVKYHNEWVTNLKPTKLNVREIATAGRQRSKIENETFNALKNHGFHFEHNFGHGKDNLSFNFLLLNLLAFLMHQLLALGDNLYREALSWKGAVREFIDYIRWAIRMVVWPDWETLLNNFLGRGPELRIDTG
ncbi:MAG: transposase, partial [Acetobacterium sp.]|nr:transposase [Acetobacterium sp.]